MARIPISVYLEAAEIAAVDRRAEAAGKTRSSWISDTLTRALGNELQPVDRVIVDQIVKLRASQEALVEVLSASNPQALETYRKRSHTLGEKWAAKVRDRVGR